MMQNSADIGGEEGRRGGNSLILKKDELHRFVISNRYDTTFN